MKRKLKNSVPIFWGLAISFLFFTLTSKSYAAEIKNIAKKQRIVLINKGKIDGFVKGAEVCFYEVSGNLVGCGTVKRAELYTSSIKVPAKIIKNIVPSQTARLKGQPGLAEALVMPAFAFRIMLSPTLISQVKFNQLIYLPPTDDAASTLWQPGETIDSAPLTFTLEADLMRYRLAVGFRGRTFRNAASQADYDIVQDEYLSMKTKASAFGTYLDAAAYKATNSTNRQFTLALGLDYDVSTVNVTGTKMTYDKTNSEDIYKIKSRLTTISARIVSKLDWIFSSSILGVGLNLLLPISSSQNLSVNSKDGVNYDKLENPDTDLRQKLDHSTNSFGVEAILSYGIPF